MSLTSTIRNTKLSVGGCLQSGTTKSRRKVCAKPSHPDQNQTTEDVVGMALHRWAEFRLSVVGHLIFCDVERGKLHAELKLLSEKKWKHPITGRPVIFGCSTIQRWYYIILNNPGARLRSSRRSDLGHFTSLSEQVRHYLARQAKMHPSWYYSQHHQTLVRYMKEHGLGLPPGCSTVQRYLLSLRSTQNDAVDEVNAKIKKLTGLTVHLRKTLIVQSTINWLLSVPGLLANTIGHLFKLSRFGPSEKAYVLSRLRDYKAAGGSPPEFCSGVGISQPTIEKWRASYKRYGESGFCVRKRRKVSTLTIHAQENKARILEIFHSQPHTFGINRASWTGESLAKALHSKFGVTISAVTARRCLRKSGYTMRRSRQVLTSSDPDYRAKVDVVVQTLRTLGDTEMFFFVDELGPLAVKKYGGRMFVKKGEALVVPQLQTPKGSIILAGALSATTNQMTWCYVLSKDTTAMIDLIELLFSEHQGKSRLYITWDAASWHDSNSLVDWLDTFNQKTIKTKNGPLIKLVPLPSCSQFLNVIESVFSVMKQAVIHHSDYKSAHQMKSAISQHFRERNMHFKDNPRRAGKKIWEINFFRDPRNLPSGNYRNY